MSQLACVAGLSRARIAQLVRDGAVVGQRDTSGDRRTVWVAQAEVERFLAARRPLYLSPWRKDELGSVVEGLREAVAEIHALLRSVDWTKHLNVTEKQRLLEQGETRAAQEPHELFGLNPRFPHPPR